MFIVDHDWLNKRPRGRKSWTGSRKAPSLYGLSGHSSGRPQRKVGAEKSSMVCPQNDWQPYPNHLEQCAYSKLSSRSNYVQQDSSPSQWRSKLNEGSDSSTASPSRPYGSSIPATPGFQLIRGLEGYLAYYLDIISTSQHPLEDSLRSKSNTLRSFWFPLAFEDDLWLQSVVLSSAAHHSRTTLQPWPIQAQQLMASFLSQLNSRIGQNTLNDGTLATISCLLLIEHDKGHAEIANTHAAGLAEIVRLRGGLLSIQRERRAKLVRADIVRAVDALEHPRLSKLPFEPDLTVKSDTSVISNAVDMAARFQNLDPDPALISPVWSISMLCQKLDLSWKKGDLLDPVPFYEEIFRACHDLLMFHAHKDIDQLIKLTLLTFMLPLYRQKPFTGDESSRLILELVFCLKSINIDTIDSEFGLWVSFICCMACEDSLWRTSLNDRLREQFRMMHITHSGAWTQVRQLLQGYLWTEAIHDRFGKRCYDLLGP